MTFDTERFSLGFSGNRLVFYPKDLRGNDVGHLDQALPLEHCRRLTATRLLPERRVELAFDFQLPTWRVQVQVIVNEAEFAPAWEFVAALRTAFPAIAYHEVDAQPAPEPQPAPVPEAVPKPEPEPEPLAEPEPDPGVREEWLSAPVSDETRALYRAVLGRLAAASRP